MVRASSRGQRHLVDGLAALKQVNAGGETDAVPFPVEVLWLEEVGNPQERVSVDEQRSDQRLLRLDVVGKELLSVHSPYSSTPANIRMVAVMSVERRRVMSYSPGSRMGSMTSTMRRSMERSMASVSDSATRALEMAP